MRKRFLLLGVLALLACRDNTIGPGGFTAVKLAPDSIHLAVGQTQPLTVTVTPSGSAVTFASSDNNIATVNTQGVVTGNAPGVTFVRALVGSGSRSAIDSTKVVVAGADMLPTLGTGLVAERFTAEVAALGTVAYTTTWGARAGLRGNALKIWNVAGNTPVLADSIVIPGAGTLSDVQISDDGALLVVSIESSNPTSLNGIRIYNRAANPLKPTLIAAFSPLSTRPGVHTVKLSRVNGRHYAFLNIDPPAALVIADITDPATPTEVLNRPMGNPFIHDVFVRDGILFAALWNDGMTIFDIGGGQRGGTPANPVQLGNVQTVNGSVHNIWWFNDPRSGSKRYAFIGEEGPASLFTWSRGDVHVVDVSDFTNPREVAFYRPDPSTSSTGPNEMGAHNFDMDEPSGILYAAFYNGGVRALDVRGDLGTCTTEQKAPDGRCDLRLMGREVGIGATGTPTFIWGVKLVGSALYASDMPNGLHKLDVSSLKR